MRVRAALLVGLLVVLLFVVTGCTATKGPVAKTSAATSPTVTSAAARPIVISGATRTLAGKELAYGASVGTIPGAVYQPDVVVIGRGADAIRSADSSGLVWTIDGSAPGVSQLAVDKIMVATTYATGRVLALSHVGGDVQVALGPVGLTDVFSRLQISSSAPIALKQPLTYNYPGSPVGSTDPDSGVSASLPSTAPTVPPTAPPVQHFAPVQIDPTTTPGTATLEGPTLAPKAVHQGKFDLTPYCCFPSQGVHISYNTDEGRMAATVGLVMSNVPLLSFSLDIDPTGVREAVFQIRGPQAIEFQFDAATTNVDGNYESPTLTLPLALTFPLAGIPFTVSLTQSIHASIQLAGQAAFQTKGQYEINGGLGFSYKNGHFGAETPTFTTKLSSLENATSLAVGINAVSLGYSARLGIGLGVLGFNAGPYFKLNGNLVIAKDGSPPQTSLTAGCVTAAVAVTASYGVSYDIPKFVVNAVNSFLHIFNAEPIRASGDVPWGPYTLFDPGRGQRCLNR